MKVRSIFFILLVTSVWLSCKSDTTEPEDITTLEGGVYFLDDNNDPTPIQGALVNAQNIFAQAITDNDGTYLMEFELAEDNTEIVLHASKVGFLTSELNVLGKKGEKIIVPDFTLISANEDSTGGIIDTATHSGPAAHIEVDGTHPTHIYVMESGLKETALIEFKVTDSQGRLLDHDHKTTVYFSILNGPGGGEYLVPDTMSTRNGRVYTVLNSGTIAGPVQIEASLSVSGNTVRTIPIRMAIYGGLPDDEHFSVAVEKVNIAGRVHWGILDNVTAFVGDKYSNPVAPGTAVYFSTDYGIVEGAAVTDNMGRATVRYMSSAPLPPLPAIESLATVTAWTYGDTVGFNSLYDSTTILLSDITDAIWVDSTYFTYTEVNAPKHFNYKVNDIWGYPLVEDTKIKVEASNGSLYGDVDLSLNDTRISGPGRTDFQFTWTPGDSLEDPLVFITIKANPPFQGNGYQSFSFSGDRAW